MDYGGRLAQEKKRHVFSLFDEIIASTPALKPRHPSLGLIVYPVSKTPFIVIYDFDDEEVRVMTCVLKGAGDRLDDFDVASVTW